MRHSAIWFRILKIVSICLVGVGVCTQVCAEAKESMELRSLEPFTQIEASNAIYVVLQDCKQNEKPEARIVCKDTSIAMDKIITHIHKGKLQIFIKKKFDLSSLTSSITNSKNIVVYLKCHRLSKVEADSAASICADKQFIIHGENFEVKAESASSIDLDIRAQEIKVLANSASLVLLKGEVKGRLILEATGASKIDTSAIDAQEVEAVATSASNIKTKVSKNLKAHASSCASILYMGDPVQKDIERDSMGKVESWAKK